MLARSCGDRWSRTGALEGVVEVDQAEIPSAKATHLEPGNAGIHIIGAVEVIDRDTNQAKPRRKHAKYLDTRPAASVWP